MDLTSLTKEGCFAIIVLTTKGGETLLRPIGGDYHNGINDTIEELNAAYPNSKMKMFETRYDAWHKYFKPNGLRDEQSFDKLISSGEYIRMQIALGLRRTEGEDAV